jgi:hypothetical protein
MTVRDTSGGTSSKAQEVLGLIYAIVYVLLAIAAIVTWVIYVAKTPDLVKNLATVSMGMFVTIITAFFRENRTP